MTIQGELRKLPSVDRLLQELPLRDWTPPRPLRRQVDRGLRRCAGSHELIRALAVLLSQLTANISIILGPGWDGVRAQRIDLYPKESGRILMVLVL